MKANLLVNLGVPSSIFVVSIDAHRQTDRQTALTALPAAHLRGGKAE